MIVQTLQGKTTKEIKDLYPNFRLDLKSFCGKLDPHQHIAVACAHISRKFLNMDKVGLGKTVETLGLISYHMDLGIKPRWVIVVLAGHILQWKREIERFLQIEPICISGPKQKRIQQYQNVLALPSFLVVMSYGMLRNDWKYIHSIPNKNMVYDEASILGNKNISHNIASHINSGSKFVLLLSGEPMTTGNPVQLFFCFTAAGVNLDFTEKTFTKTFCKERIFPIWVKSKRRNSSRGFKKYISKVVGAKNIPLLKQMIEPFSIRRGDSVLPQGPVTINSQIRSCRMTKEQKQLWEDLRRGVLKRQDDLTKVEKLHILEKMTQLLIAPSILDPSWGTQSPKIDLLASMLNDELRKQQVVIFCKHLASCDLVAKSLKKHNISVAQYDGRMGPEEKSQSLKRFLDKSRRIFIMTAAGHRGLDGLQRVCNALVVLTPVYSPAFTIQLIGRLARKEQPNRRVNVYYLLAEESAEVKIFSSLYQQQTTNDLVFGGSKAKLFNIFALDKSFISYFAK